MAKHKATGKICALKKIIFHNENDGVINAIPLILE
jgi:hypothetical protein